MKPRFICKAAGNDIVDTKVFPITAKILVLLLISIQPLLLLLCSQYTYKVTRQARIIT